MLQINNLTKTYGSNPKPSVENLSLTVNDGEIFGFIGPNGAGKTTAIKIMSTLDLPDSGDVFYDGTSVLLKPDEVRRIIGICRIRCRITRM